jgi:mono/diheme cytochrome c family protein
VVCHGKEATGHIGPRLAGNAILADDQAFRKTVHEGRHMMPPLKDALTEEHIADILAWLRTLR